MLKSMTGFSRYENQNEDLTCKVEIRSVNNRFIDVNTRLPKSLAPLELPLKKMVKSKCARGSFDISIAIEKNGDSEVNLEVAPNPPLAHTHAFSTFVFPFFPFVFPKDLKSSGFPTFLPARV